MKYLFFARHFTYLRNFESVLCALAERGHQVHIAAERDEEYGGREMIDRLAERYPGLTAGPAPERTDGWYRIATKLRLTLDYLRYLEPAYESTPRLRMRAEERVPKLLLATRRVPGFRGIAGRRRLARLLLRWERAIPLDPGILHYVQEVRPDAVLITPLIGVVASPQLDYLYSAQSLGIPTALCVWSWDHLSSKALIRTLPDRVLVWNPTQRDEAVDLHGVPAERVVVTGAQCFDQWFDRAPSRPREEFCRSVGLDPARPYLLWVCSALIHGSPVEATLVLEWIRRIRASADPALRGIGILVRPHPSRLTEWQELGPLESGAVVWGSNPIDAQARADYFDSLYHSAAVVGINTSAFIEAGIAGRPVFTIVTPEFEENQYGTVHFRYLLDAGGGLLTVAQGFDEHLAQLLASLQAPPEGVRPFVREFVRPLGLDRAATPVFVAEVEAMAGTTVAEAPVDALASMWRWLLPRIGRMKDQERFERWTLSPREQASAERLRGLRAEKAIRRAMSRAVNDEQRQRKLQERAVRAEEARRRRVEARRSKQAASSPAAAGAAARGRD